MQLPKPPIDHAVLDSIRSLQLPDSSDLVGQILRTYIDDSADLMLAIAAAVREADGERVRSAAHSLKSSSGNVGAKQVVDLARRLEMAGRENEPEEFEALFLELQIELSRAVAELDTMVVAA